MKIIQSLWTKPIHNNSGSKSVYVDRLMGGWLDYTSYLMSCSLSCLQLRKYYKDVELVTDDLGRRILIDWLKLPYTKVSLELNELRNENPDLWALGKIASFKLQKDAFLHVDNDVYIFNRFSNKIEEGELICQNFDINHKEYFNILMSIENLDFKIPDPIKEERQTNKNVIASNAGIIGGRNIDFFGKFSDYAFDFVCKNNSKLGYVHSPTLNIIFEQYLFYCLAKQLGIKITTLFERPDEGGAPEYCVRFFKTPVSNKYIHMIADYKRNYYLIEKMKLILRINHPKEYFRIVNLILNSNDLALIR